MFVRPLQTGPRFVRRRDHENERRAGTENVAGIIGLTESLERFVREPVFDRVKLSKLVESLRNFPSGRSKEVEIVGSQTQRIANTLAFVVKKFPMAWLLLAGLDSGRNLRFRAVRACSAGSLEPSHVIFGVGISPGPGEFIGPFFSLGSGEYDGGGENWWIRCWSGRSDVHKRYQ